MVVKTFFNALLAGIALGIAGTVNLSVENRVVGAFLFGFGLFWILCYDFKLYTGAVGYWILQGWKFLSYGGTLLIILLGNFAGTSFLGWVIRHTRLENVVERANALCLPKMQDEMLSLFLLSFLCGILMYLAVETFRSSRPDIFRVLMVFLCVSIFILAGFEHCIANMYYFAAAGQIHPLSMKCLAVMVVGNGVGGMFLPLMDRVR
ncbi:MAG: formate/nitrite transporter family protein [Planctomycetia bacterium]|nr:formate/nitrite transporter family protein [Planctomycetia bacterium]MDO5112903.1 formate/nitrite transporter family protein [Planctomycetia bacterium]